MINNKSFLDLQSKLKRYLSHFEIKILPTTAFGGFGTGCTVKQWKNKTIDKFIHINPWPCMNHDQRDMHDEIYKLKKSINNS